MVKIIVAVDFDGTTVTHKYPKVGEEVPDAISVIKELIEAGVGIILYTMRSDSTLQDAIKWYADRGIALYGINLNPSQKNWTNSPKCYAHYYVDDAAVGCPLIYVDDPDERPYVNWKEIRKFFIAEGILYG